MTDLRDAARQALEALETVFMPHHPAVIALRAALAEDALQRLTDANQEIEAVLEQEPVEIKPPNPEGATQCIVRWMAETPAGWVGAWDREALKQFTHPPRREWRGLTDEEMVAIAHRKCWEYRHSSDRHHSHTYKFNHSTLTDFRYAIEGALKERNHD
jgi:hypothetical protein